MAVSKQDLYTQEDQITSEFFRALSHPARLSILRKLEEDGACCVQVIAAGHPISQEALSGHLKILRKVHLVNWKERFPYTFYSIHATNFAKAKSFITSFFGLFHEMQ